MKKLQVKIFALLMAAGFVSLNAMAKTGDKVPQAASSAFSAKYPGANLKTWKMRGDTCVAMFTMNKRNYKAFYGQDGSWYMTQRNVKHLTTLPLEAQHYLKKGKYASWHIDDLAKVETPSRTMYLVQIDNHSGSPSDYQSGSDSNKSLYFNLSGRLIRAN